MYIDKTRTYVGVVEENIDPKKLGRCKIRVIDIFDDIPINDIPWAAPWKDLNGNEFNIPDKGKVVTVVFDSGNIYKPEYIYAEHFNINLEKKLNSLSENDYKSFKSLLFDHKTQIYVNDSEGLKIDYKYNNININDSSIDLNLKDNFGKLNLGDSSCDQRVIQGSNFLEWFDEFMNILIGNQGGAYTGNLGVPVLPTPGLLKVITKYKSLKETKFLSNNVFTPDNSKISSIRQAISSDENLRIDEPQLGDSWKSTTNQNNLVNIEQSDYKPQYGNGSETPEAYSQDGEPVSISVNQNDNVIYDSSMIKMSIGQPDGDVDKILSVMYKKKYKIDKRPFYINLIAIRYQYEGQNYSNKFKDKLYAIWKNSNDQWESKSWSISTIPGLYYNKSNNTKMKEWASINRSNGIGLLVPAQYENIYKFEESSENTSSVSMRSRPIFKSVGEQLVYLDRNWDSDKITFSNKNELDRMNHNIFIHRGFPGGIEVNNWSEGSQVFSNERDYKQLCNLARIHIQKNGNSFNYTLLLSIDIVNETI
jgi:hypothetical protein